ncbi:hypothetical protein CCR75_008806 [Bremia lactucae]|uniref:GAF domain-containing protein n=1 Tax=Bremia lactucae TaxID=4779 RepID=A0A976ICA5_BRELC|nr:hypothetical protein CCR75_008806 [Bremia lactucae]
MEQEEGSNPRRYVRASDRRLAEVATQAAARIDIETLQYRRSESTGVTTERSHDGTTVTVTCVIACSLNEMQALLVPSTSDQYACIMRELFGQDFIYGAIVHHANDVSVRTATFAKRHLLRRHEQWCFASAIKPLKSSHTMKGVPGFTVSVASLHPDDVFIGKAQAGQVTHIQGLSALYLVTTDPSQSTNQYGRLTHFVRVTLCMSIATTAPLYTKVSPLRWFVPSKNRNEATEASNGVILARAMQYARNLKHFQVVVRRRRLDAQVLVDLQKVQPRNSRCACCTHRFPVFRTFFENSLKQNPPRLNELQGPRRCQLCGFLVCSKCVRIVGNESLSSDSLDTLSSRIKYSHPVCLCEHCMQRIDDADYDSYCASNPTSILLNGIEPDSPNAEAPSAIIARLLSQVLDTASKEDIPVVIRVIKYLLNRKHDKTMYSYTDYLKLARRCNQLADEYGFSNEIDFKDAMKPKTLEMDFQEKQEHRYPLAGAHGRSYALRYTNQSDESFNNDSDDTDDSEGTEDADEVEHVQFVARHPVPLDESARLRWLAMHPNMISHVMDLPDLALLCTIAHEELQCDAAVVTLFGATACSIIASSDPALRGFEIPRDQAICGHTVMTNEPLLIRHLEADVRFAAMDQVRCQGLRFYFGFPIKLACPRQNDTVVVGTFCCVQGGKTREISESQYTLMATLTEGVKQVLEFQAALLLDSA